MAETLSVQPDATNPDEPSASESGRAARWLNRVFGALGLSDEGVEEPAGSGSSASGASDRTPRWLNRIFDALGLNEPRER